MTRDAVLTEVAHRLCAREVGHPLRVGVDGVCAAGKTTFAGELAQHIRGLGRSVVHLDSDGFHHVRSIRSRQGAESARGYYEDAYDFDALREHVLVPLATDRSGRYASRVHDLASDEVDVEWATAPTDAILLFAATFLQRDHLREHWDEVIYLDADFSRAQSRGIARDADALGGVARAEAAYETRYMAACRIYCAEQDPRRRASIVIDHDDPMHPSIVRA